MQVAAINTRSASLARQKKLYEEAGLSADVTLPLPFALNYESFLNVPALEAIGVNALGLARQMDQVLKENLGNAWNAFIKQRVSKKKGLPTAEEFATFVEKYDFSGTRTASEEGLSDEERFIRTEIRTALRDLLRSGALHPEGKPALVQTKAEAEKNELPENKVDLETFEALVGAAEEGGVAEVAWDNCSAPENNTTWRISFEGAAEFDGNGDPTNLPAVVEAAKAIAAEKLAVRAKRAGTVKVALTK
jgi:hypothetical protein